MMKCRGPGHFNQQYAGQTLEWSGTDSKETFESNLKVSDKFERLKLLGWLENNITYAYNSEGFRDIEFDQRPAVMALGCSHTEGVGLTDDKTWPRQLENLIGQKVWNLGVGGSALDTCFRLLDYWIKHLNITAVCCAVPGISRFEVNENNSWSNILPANESMDWIAGWNKNYIAFEQNGIMNRRKNLLAMEHICSLHHVPFYYDLLENFGDGANARDLLHCGPGPNTKLAATFDKIIQGKSHATR